MKLLNQKGFTMVEITIALGIAIAAAAYYAMHSANVSRYEAMQKLKKSIDGLEVEANEWLKSRAICDRNMNLAFANVPLTGPTVSGNSLHRKLQGRGQEIGGVMVYKDIFLPATGFEGGKIWVKDVEYTLEGLQSVTIPNAPWNKQGDLKIKVTFERCKDNKPVFIQDPNGLLVQKCLPADRIESSKILKKMAAFKVNASNVLTASACADSQDALIEAANKFAQEKFCILEARMMANNGASGTTPAPCNYIVTMTDVEKNTSGNHSIPSSVVPKSLKVKMIFMYWKNIHFY
jgi:type II secretory pathway pseudopilin PulG